MPQNEFEARGVTCLECTALDLKSIPDLAKEGTGRCLTGAVFVRAAMSRNCFAFQPAAPATTAARVEWFAKLPKR